MGEKLHAFTSHRERVKRYIVLWHRKTGRDGEFHLEIPYLKKVGPGFRIHFGDRGSETPFDGHISLYWVAIFWGMNFPGLGRFCEWIGRGHKRNISVQFHNKAVWWELWYDDDMGYDDWHKCNSWRKPKLYPWRWGREKHRGWMCLRKGNLELNPLDALWGHRYFDFHEVGKTTALVPINDFEGDEYEVEFKLEKQTRGRRFGPKFARRRSDEGWNADWRCETGIPVRNHDWKGDEVFASAVSVDLNTGEDWVAQAVKSLIEQIRRDRIHYNYVPPKERVRGDLHEQGLGTDPGN